MSQTVTGSALQFTNDNKHAYAYSGVKSVDDNETTLLEVSTNSEYINAHIQFNYVASANQDFTYKIYFNDVIVQQYNVGNSVIYTSPDNFLYVVIPPFTDVKLTAQNISDSTQLNQIVSLTGKVGMPQRVGNE